MAKLRRGWTAPPPAEISESVARLLALAQQTADLAIHDAKAEAEKIINDARAEADRILAEARQQAERQRYDQF
jgi:vacuolar-type H+-ATPase subunit H